jgi:plastocyanin
MRIRCAAKIMAISAAMLLIGIALMGCEVTPAVTPIAPKPTPEEILTPVPELTPSPTVSPEPSPATSPTPSPTVSPTPVDEEPVDDEEIAQQLWQELQDAVYQGKWQTIPGKGILYPGQPPHGVYVSTYLNEVAAQALETPMDSLPEGAIVVKENYTIDNRLAAITVMQKRASYYPEYGDWFWAEYNVMGEIRASGRLEGCISCHAAAQSNDYVFTFPINTIDVEGAEATDQDLEIAQQLWQDLEDADYQDNWETIPGKGSLYPGQPPHGGLVSTYLNAAAAQALETSMESLPDGAIVLKENYTLDEELIGITLMQKRTGYYPEYADWFWAQYGPEGEIQGSGRIGSCISCHAAMQSNDYVFTFPINTMPGPAPTPAVQPSPTPTEEPDTEVRTIEVIARNYEFEPDTIRVQVGQLVEFVVSSPDEYHTFTVKESVDATEDIINLKVFPDDEPVSVQHTFKELGEYYLYCILHEGLGMTGMIIVE